MKKLIIYSFLTLLIVAGCRKEDNVRVPESAEVPLPLFTKDPTASLIISSETPDAFSGRFTIGLHYPEGLKPLKFDIVIRKNEVNASAKVLKSDIKAFPSLETVTGVQLREAFGTIVLGDIFDIGVDVTTQDGKKYLAFPAKGTAYGTNVANIAGSRTIARYEAVCPFKMTEYGAIGSTVPFVVEADGWNDYPAGSTVDVTIIDATHLSFFYPTADNIKPIVITVNPNDNSTSVDKIAFGDYGDGLIFSAVSVEGSLSNAVYPCKLTVGASLAFSGSNGGNYGTGVITLKKK